MTPINRRGIVLLAAALTTGTATTEARQRAIQTFTPESAGLRVNEVVTVCGEALDLGCHGPQPGAMLTFITPSASPPVSIDAAGQIQGSSWPLLLRPHRVCVTGKIAATTGGYQVQITGRDQIVFGTEPVVADAAARPRRSCDPGVTAPTLRRDVKPQYSPDATRRMVSGRVVLYGLVDSGGAVQDVQVIRTLDPGGLDVAAANALGQWVFEPGRWGGEPVPMLVMVDMVFTMKPE